MAYLSGGSSTLPLASTNSSFDSTGYDRFILAHVSVSQSNTITFWKIGPTNVKLADTVAMSSNDVRDFGPWFFGSSEYLAGGGGTSSGGLVLDVRRV